MSIFYCLYFRDSPNLEDQVPVFISPRNRVAQLYPQALSLDIVHRSNFYLKHDFLETGFCLRLQVGPTERASLCRQTPATATIGFLKPNTTQASNEN
jgi:hypothetical protein